MSTATADSRAIAVAVGQGLRDAGITQQRAAEASGVPLSTLKRRLSGAMPLKVDELAALADLLGTTPTALVKRAETDGVTSNHLTEGVRTADAINSDPFEQLDRALADVRLVSGWIADVCEMAATPGRADLLRVLGQLRENRSDRVTVLLRETAMMLPESACDE